jgi:hypothetical protein
MTANTTYLLILDVSMRSFDRLHDILVTLATGLFRHGLTTRRNLNVVFKPAGCEVVGMPETVSRFSSVFANEPGRRMTIVAHRY